MQIEVVRHFPNYMEMDEKDYDRQIIDCSTENDSIYFIQKLKENIWWVKHFTEDLTFSHYEILHNTMHQSLLVAHYTDEKFYVVGYLNIIDNDYHRF